jgi:S1-C subfamily serine protease
MFVKAIGLATGYTWPRIVSIRRPSGRVQTEVGTLVVVNPEGWFVTAAHLLSANQQAAVDRPKVEAHDQAVKAITGDAGLTVKQQREKVGRLRQDPAWITDVSYWWGRDGVTVGRVEVDPLADLAVGRFGNFDSSWVPAYPHFKSTAAGDLPPGASLCRLGFPFHEVASTFDQSTGRFTLAPGTFPMPWFPNEGILTRIPQLPDPASGRIVKFMETSSPGLRGQSGGPIFDVNGTVWGIQSRTVHLPLGFSPEQVLPDGKKVTEHQFLNVGVGSHVDEIIRLLATVGVTPMIRA